MSRYTGNMLEKQVEEWNKELAQEGSGKRLAVYYEYGKTYIVWCPAGETKHFSIGGNTPRDCYQDGNTWMIQELSK